MAYRWMLLLLLLNVLNGSYGFKEFFFGVLGTSGGSDPDLTLIIHTLNMTASLTVQIATETVHSGPVSDGSKVDLPANLVVASNSLSERTKGLHAYTDDDSLSLVLLITYGTSSDSLLIYPNVVFSEPFFNEYIVVADYREDQACVSQVLLVGAKMATEITVYPTIDVIVPKSTDNSLSEVIHAGSSWNFVLDEFHTVLLSSDVGSLSGTVISSNQTLTVISGCDCSSLATGSFKVEQMPPTVAWGRKYVVPDFQIDNQVVTVIASLHYTVVNVSCLDRPANIVVLNRTNSFNFTSDGLCYIDSDSPILVMISFNGSVMSVIPSIEQSSSEFTFGYYPCSLGVDVSLSTFNSTAGIYLNGTDISDASWNRLNTDSESVFSYNFKLVASGTTELRGNGAPVSSITYSNSGCLYAHPSAYELIPLPAANISLSQRTYEVSESDERFTVVVERFDSLSKKTRLKLEMFSDTMDELYIRDVIFEREEILKEIIISFTDDKIVEPSEVLSVYITQQNEPLNIFPIAEAQVTILDNDNITVGVYSIVYDEPQLVIGFGITNGKLTSSLSIEVSLQLNFLSVSLFYNTTLSQVLSEQSISVNLQEALSANESISSNTSFTLILTVVTDQYSICVHPNIITDSLQNRTQTATSDPNDVFVISEFTAQSLLVITCIAAAFLVVIFIILIISGAVCLSFCRYGKKWSVTGTMNRMYFEDDAISLSTNDPETYELMNKLGDEQKRSMLTIHDTKSFSKT